MTNFGFSLEFKEGEKYTSIMKPRVFIIHGWGGSPESDWLPWAKKAIQEKGYEVFVPEMLETNHPKTTAWVEKLKETVGYVKSDDILIGHSIGCLTILRFLEKLEEASKVQKVILIAPWQYLVLGSNEDIEDVRPWTETPVDYEKIKTKANTFTAVFSDNDPFVPMQKNIKFFKEKLNPEIIVKNQMGHFSGEEGVTKIPFLLELLTN